jgi:hypothetical protein
MASLVKYLHISGVRSTDLSIHEDVLKADADEGGVGGAGGTCHHASGACHMAGDHVGKTGVGVGVAGAVGKGNKPARGRGEGAIPSGYGEGVRPI